MTRSPRFPLETFAVDHKDFSDTIAFDDHKIAFTVGHCSGRSVLDIGCVNHNPQNYKSRYWVHKAITAVSKDVVGLDDSTEGVSYLTSLGYNIVAADAQNFNLGRRFEVIVAGDLIEHLVNFDGFLRSCLQHLEPHGRLLLSSPNPWYWKNTARAMLYPEVKNNIEHTCWLCPRTMRQLLARYGMEVEELRFGSRYRRDRLMPLPPADRQASGPNPLK